MVKVSWYVWRNCWNIVNGIIKSLWLFQPWFDNCKARGIWSWRKQFKTHTKLHFPKTAMGKSCLVLQWIVWDYLWGSTRIYTRTNYFQCFCLWFAFFIKETDICNSTDDATLYACGKELDTISFKLEIETSTAIEWLKDNEMIANLSKFQLMFLSKTLKTTCLLIKKPSESSDTVELLGIALGKNIDLTRHMQNICHKENN